MPARTLSQSWPADSAATQHPASLVATRIAETKAERARYQLSERLTPGSRMSEAEIKAIGQARRHCARPAREGPVVSWIAS